MYFYLDIDARDDGFNPEPELGRNRSGGKRVSELSDILFCVLIAYTIYDLYGQLFKMLTHFGHSILFVLLCAVIVLFGYNSCTYYRIYLFAVFLIS